MARLHREEFRRACVVAGAVSSLSAHRGPVSTVLCAYIECVYVCDATCINYNQSSITPDADLAISHAPRRGRRPSAGRALRPDRGPRQPRREAAPHTRRIEIDCPSSTAHAPPPPRRHSTLTLYTRSADAADQRSISPKTTSSVPMMVTTSASMCPWERACKPARWARPGARMWQRYGLLEPSETM